MSDRAELEAYRQRAELDQYRAANQLPKPSSQSEPPSLSDAALELGQGWAKSIKKSVGDYGRGGYKAAISYLDMQLPDEYKPLLEVIKDGLANEQAKADIAYQPYRDANPGIDTAVGLIPDAMGMLPQSRVGGMAAEALIQGGKYSNNQLTEMLLGAGGAGIGEGVSKFISKGMNQVPGAQNIVNRGVRLTPGDRAGGASKWIEDAAVNAPIVGNFIKQAKNRSIDDYSGLIKSDALIDAGVGDIGINHGSSINVDVIRKAISKNTDKYTTQEKIIKDFMQETGMNKSDAIDVWNEVNPSMSMNKDLNIPLATKKADAIDSVSNKDGRFLPQEYRNTLLFDKDARDTVPRETLAANILPKEIYESKPINAIDLLGGAGMVIKPELMIPAAAGVGAYTETGVKGINKVLFDRPNDKLLDLFNRHNIFERIGRFGGADATTDEEYIKYLERKLK